jgi:hypothetical protein
MLPVGQETRRWRMLSSGIPTAAKQTGKIYRHQSSAKAKDWRQWGRTSPAKGQQLSDELIRTAAVSLLLFFQFLNGIL